MRINNLHSVISSLPAVSCGLFLWIIVVFLGKVRQNCARRSRCSSVSPRTNIFYPVMPFLGSVGSLLARHDGVAVVGGSNPLAPTNLHQIINDLQENRFNRRNGCYLRGALGVQNALLSRLILAVKYQYAYLYHCLANGRPYCRKSSSRRFFHWQ
jgi:hypothetical protein